MAIAVQAADGERPALVPFAPEHLRRLEPGRHERAALHGLHPGQLAHVRLDGPAVTLICGGRVLGCAGAVPEGADGIVWSCLSDALRRRKLLLHRTARRLLAAVAPRFRALRCHVRADFTAGRRWVRALGFRHVCDHANYLETGRTYSEYEMAQAAPFIAFASAVASAAQSAAGARSQAGQAAYRADILRRQAAHEARILQAKSDALRRRQSGALSAQRASLAARGVDPAAGSALLAQEQAAADAELEALLARAIGGARLFDDRARAGRAALDARTARQDARFRAGHSLLTAAGTISDQWPKIGNG